MRTAAELRGGVREPRLWFQEALPGGGCVAAAACTVAGLLPEDVFDRQPLVSPAGAVLVAQCRLDGREHLARRAGVSEPAQAADADLLLAAYLRWGEACVDYLEGDFAFACYDPVRRSIFAAVDGTGQSRLFYRTVRGGLLLSAQLRVLARAATERLRPNTSALGLLAAGVLRPGETGFEGVHALPGGHALRWSDGTAEVRRWWQPDTEPQTQYARPQQYVEHALDLLQSAVRGSLRTSGPVSASLSGGLDSGLVTALAARQMADAGASLDAYTAAPQPERATLRRRGWDPDDLPFAAATAAMYPNVRHRPVYTADAVALDLFDALREGSATAIRNGANHVWLAAMAQRMQAAGSRVLLTGGRGNYTLSYSGVGGVVELLRRLQWSAAIRLAFAMDAAGERAAWKSLGGALLPQRGFDAIWTRWSGAGGKNGNAAEELMLTEGFRREQMRVWKQDRPPRRTRAAFARRAMLPAPLWAVDALPQWGVQMRDPTANRCLVEALLTMPLDAFVQGGRMRGLAREAGKGILPEMVRLRRTQGQQAADYAVAVGRRATAYHESIERISGEPAVRAVFSPSAMHGVVDAIAGGENALALTSGIDRALGAALFLMAVERDGY